MKKRTTKIYHTFVKEHTHHHKGIQSIDYYAYASGLSEWNASYKVILAFVTLLLCILADDIMVSVFVIVTMGMLNVIGGKISVRNYLNLLKIPLAFMIMGSIAIAFEISQKPSGNYYIYVTKDTVLETVCVFFKSFGAISAMYMMALNTPVSELTAVLGKLHLPKLMIELMHMIYRFIFILLEVQGKMKISAQSRLGYIDFKTSCKSFGNTAANLLIVSLKKANTYYDAMVSRCYDGELLFLIEEKSVSRIQILGMIIYFMVLIGLMVCRI